MYEVGKGAESYVVFLQVFLFSCFFLMFFCLSMFFL